MASLTVVLAEQQRTRRGYLAEVEPRAAQLARARNVEARHAVQDERVRIARELHDVVAHHVSMGGGQAEAASVTAVPAVRTALEAIADTARSALGIGAAHPASAKDRRPSCVLTSWRVLAVTGSGSRSMMRLR